MTGPRTAAEDDYRRGFHDAEVGRPQAGRSDSYVSGWRVGRIFARDVVEPLEAPKTPRTVDISDVIAELPRKKK